MGKASSYLLRYGGKDYDSKAIFAAAHGHHPKLQALACGPAIAVCWPRAARCSAPCGTNWRGLVVRKTPERCCSAVSCNESGSPAWAFTPWE
jgi:hypothetical protein